jgi:prefoldin subunit 5
MDEMQVIGYAVTTIITLGAFVVVIQRFTQPIGELRLAIQKLIDTIDTLKSDNATQNKRIERHGEEIDNLNRKVEKIETKMEMYHHGEQ